jgi:hypothetical protein
LRFFSIFPPFDPRDRQSLPFFSEKRLENGETAVFGGIWAGRVERF